MSQEPIYLKISDDMKQKIASGVYPAGAQLPSETELMNLYHVSRITVRSAIDLLYQDGLIEKKQGKRSYVKDNTLLQDMTTVKSYTEEIVQHGMTPSRKVISAVLRLPDAEEQASLNIDKASPVFFLERIIYADNEPLCYTKTTLPYSLFRDIEKYDFSDTSLYNKIENEYGVKIVSSRVKIKAVSSDRKVSQYLEIDKDMPVLLTSAVTYGSIDGQTIPIEAFTTYYLTDRFEYTITNFRD